MVRLSLVDLVGNHRDLTTTFYHHVGGYHRVISTFLLHCFVFSLVVSHVIYVRVSTSTVSSTRHFDSL